MTKMFYISYGSNMNLRQMAYRAPNTKVYGKGILQGWQLVFNCHADIIQTGNEEDTVPVVVWEITNYKDLYALDCYEGYPSYYTKKNIDVVMETGEIINAMVYVMADRRKGIYPPDVNYFNGILQGYTENKIDTKPLYDALKHCVQKENLTEHNQYNPAS